MKKSRLNFFPDELKYAGVVGTGGIGSGKFFMLNGEHTLGREESRSGRYLDVRDYCKQHIVLHYIQVFMGPHFKVIPIGKLGGDEIGSTLIREMTRTGFDMRYVEIERDRPSLFSFCFQYSDGTGGNLTTDNSASAAVDQLYIDRAMGEIESLGSRGIVMAAPEVPLISRARLLELGRQNGLFCSASFTTEEIRLPDIEYILPNIDLVAINLDEAFALTGLNDETNTSEEIVKAAIQKLQLSNDGILVSITSGKLGSWCWDGEELNFYPGIDVDVVSTPGAGDAFFSGILTGLALGLSLFESQELASLTAAMSVCSPHTIHHGIQRKTLLEFARLQKISLSENVSKLLEESSD